jgi:hypothetical protein
MFNNESMMICLETEAAVAKCIEQNAIKFMLVMLAAFTINSAMIRTLDKLKKSTPLVRLLYACSLGNMFATLFQYPVLVALHLRCR